VGQDRKNTMNRHAQHLLHDALTEPTKKERRNLLGVATAGIVVVLSGVRPTTISAFGITFVPGQYESLLFLWGVIVIYFFLAFVIYVVCDFISWRFAVINASRKQEIDDRQFESSQQTKRDELSSKFQRGEESLTEVVVEKMEMAEKEEINDRVVDRYQRPSQVIFFLRMLFDVLLPILIGGYAISLLLFR
jgi:hypothetical protein